MKPTWLREFEERKLIRNGHKTKLCEDCPLTRTYQTIAFNRTIERQMTRLKEEPSPLKLCQERRKLLAEMKLKPCKYWRNFADITSYAEVTI